MKAEIHGGGLPNLHLACAIPNNSYYEILVFGEPAQFAHNIGPDSCIFVPNDPGIGYQFDWEELKQKAVLKIE